MKFSESYPQTTSKHRSYFEVYDDIFYKKDFNRLNKYNILEIGIDTGFGLKSLKKYFPNSNIYGLDINLSCKNFEEEGIKVIIGSQVDQNVLNEIKNIRFDIIIDDGSHHNDHVTHTFNELFDSLKPKGLYIIEDIHTSYWPYYGGGYLNKNSTIEKFKSMIDSIHSWCIEHPISDHIPPYIGEKFDHNELHRKWIRSIQFYENIIVIEKRQTESTGRKPV